MKIVFDMDNTLTDEFGASVRPGITDLLIKLRSDGHTLILWTNSTRERALEILRYHNLKKFFTDLIFREDYDPDNKNIPKDIRKVKGDFLIDDDPAEIRFIRSIKKKGFLIKPFRKNKKMDLNELKELYQEIKKRSKNFRFF